MNYLILLILMCISCLTSGECPIGQYLRGGACQRCLPKCGSRQIVIGRCDTNLTRFICQCPENSYWNRELSLCQKCDQCILGQIIVQNCTHDFNRKCKECPEDTFAKSRYQSDCKKCSYCDEGLVVLRKCSKWNDTECTKPMKGSPPFEGLETDVGLVATPSGSVTTPVEEDSETILVLSIVNGLFVIIFVISIMVCLCQWCSRRTSPQKGQYSNPSLTDSEMVEFVKKRPPSVIDNGMLFRDLPAHVIEQLCQFLNPEGFKSWKALAARLNFNQTQIGNFALEKSEACQKLFSEWGTERNSTVFVLYNHLFNMQRDDCTELLLPFLQGENIV